METQAAGTSGSTRTYLEGKESPQEINCKDTKTTAKNLKMCKYILLIRRGYAVLH